MCFRVSHKNSHIDANCCVLGSGPNTHQYTAVLLMICEASLDGRVTCHIHGADANEAHACGTPSPWSAVVSVNANADATAEARNAASRAELEDAMRQAAALFRSELAAKSSELEAMRYELRSTSSCDAQCSERAAGQNQRAMACVTMTPGIMTSPDSPPI